MEIFELVLMVIGGVMLIGSVAGGTARPGSLVDRLSMFGAFGGSALFVGGIALTFLFG